MRRLVFDNYQRCPVSLNWIFIKPKTNLVVWNGVFLEDLWWYESHFVSKKIGTNLKTLWKKSWNKKQNSFVTDKILKHYYIQYINKNQKVYPFCLVKIRGNNVAFFKGYIRKQHLAMNYVELYIIKFLYIYLVCSNTTCASTCQVEFVL